MTNLFDRFRALALLTLIMTFSGGCAAEQGAWSPNPKFSIDGSSYIETLTFVSGLAYGMQYTDKELKGMGRSNFFCVESSDKIDSRMIIEALNEKLSGDVTADTVIRVLVTQLKVKYPCDILGK